jgi:hypothetical protein
MKSSSRPRLLPEIFAIGLVITVGALVWTSMFGPSKEPPPELAASAAAAPAPARVPPSMAPGKWKKPAPAQLKAAQASIIQQLEAFKKDDYQQAVKYQSTGLRRNFADVDHFRQMMLSTYPEFAHYKKIVFGKALATPDGGRIQVAVRLWGQDGERTQAVYMMVKEQGVYHVDGVMGGMTEPGAAQAT